MAEEDVGLSRSVFLAVGSQTQLALRHIKRRKLAATDEDVKPVIDEDVNLSRSMCFAVGGPGSARAPTWQPLVGNSRQLSRTLSPSMRPALGRQAKLTLRHTSRRKLAATDEGVKPATDEDVNLSCSMCLPVGSQAQLALQHVNRRLVTRGNCRGRQACHAAIGTCSH